MVNVNKIKLIVIDLDGREPPLELFDVCEFDKNRLVGAIPMYKSTVNSLNGFEYTLYDITDENPVGHMSESVDFIKEFIGYNMSIDDILDIILDSDIDRRFYLESYLYYKSNQEGKPINKFTIDVNYYDDFIHYLSEDIITDEVIKNNEDFSKSTVKIETYLTKPEIVIKFKDYLLGIVE